MSAARHLTRRNLTSLNRRGGGSEGAHEGWSREQSQAAASQASAPSAFDWLYQTRESKVTIQMEMSMCRRFGAVMVVVVV